MQHTEYARAVGGEGVRFEGGAHVFARVQWHPQALERRLLVPARQILVTLEGVLGNATLPVVRVLLRADRDGVHRLGGLALFAPRRILLVRGDLEVEDWPVDALSIAHHLRRELLVNLLAAVEGMRSHLRGQ